MRVCDYIYGSQANYPQSNLINFETTYNFNKPLPLLAKRRAIFAFTTADCDFLTASGEGPPSQGALTSIKHYAHQTFSPLLRCERAQDFNKTLVIWGLCSLPCGSLLFECCVLLIYYQHSTVKKEMIYDGFGLAILFANKNNKRILRQWDLKLIHNIDQMFKIPNESLFRKICNIISRHSQPLEHLKGRKQ